MYSVNDVPLDNDTYGWSMLRRSQPLTPISKSLTSITVPGRNGVIKSVPAFKGAPSVTLVVRTPLTGIEPLYALFDANAGQGYFSLSEAPDRNAFFELVSLEPEGINAEDELVNVTVTLRFPTADWRSVSRVVAGPIVPTSPVMPFTVFSDISSDITDMDFFISGNFANFSLLDEGSNSWLKTIKTFPYSAGTGLLYVGATGQAFRAATTNPWVPTADMSDYIDVSGGGGFRITPTWTTDPGMRSASMELTTINQSGVAFTLRAYNAFALRSI